MYKRKFEKGPTITTLDDLVSEILSNHYVYVHDKPQHPGWMISQHLSTLLGQVRRGVVSVAIPTDEYWRAERRRAKELSEAWAEERRENTGATPEELGI